MITNKEKNTIATIDTESNLVHKTGNESIDGSKTFLKATAVIGGNIGTADGVHTWFNTSTLTGWISAFFAGTDWRNLALNAKNLMLYTKDNLRLTVDENGKTTFTGEVSAKLNTPQGHMLNGKIVTSVTSGTLTVAIKTLAGNDPSTADPVYVRIGNTIKTLNTARQVVMGTSYNWLNLASTELINQEVDLFVYLWNDTVDNSVGMLVSRIPYARVCNDFTNSDSAEKGIAKNIFATITGTDEVENVGRINAIYNTNWSIPATSVIINRPIFETRTLTYTSQPLASGGGFSLGNGSVEGQYMIVGRMVNMRGRFDCGSTTNMGTGQLSFTIPIQNDIGSLGIQLRTLSGGSGTAYNGTSYPITPVTNFHNGNGGVLWCVNNTANGGFVGVNNPFAWVAGCYAGAGWSYNLI